MELRSLTPDMPALLMEMGVAYDPQRLADVLADREVEVAARAVAVATQLGGCVAAVAKVGRRSSQYLHLSYVLYNAISTGQGALLLCLMSRHACRCMFSSRLAW